jgi:hypothetical protein
VENGLRVFENWVLRIYCPKRGDVTEQWRKLHHEELNDLHPSPNIFRVIKSRRMRWARHGGGKRNACGLPIGKPD